MGQFGVYYLMWEAFIWKRVAVDKETIIATEHAQKHSSKSRWSKEAILGLVGIFTMALTSRAGAARKHKNHPTPEFPVTFPDRVKVGVECGAEC